MTVAYRRFEELPLSRLRAVVAGRVELAVVFGSVVTEKTHAESDVDIALWPLADTDLDRLAGELMSALGTDAVDVADLRRADPTLHQIVATRGRLVYEDPAGRFAAFAAVAERRWEDERRRLPDRIRALDLWLERRGVR